GAGKSTILKLIANLVQPTEGTVAVKGKIQALMELGTGFHPEFTGRENVISALAYQGITGRRARALLDDVLDFSELEDFIDKPIKTYSAGMYSRLAFAAATAVSPEILIIDEILGAGDAYFAGKSARRMRELTADGSTVLFVSHDMSAVQMICDRAVWIERGQIIADGHPIEVGKKYASSIRKQEEMRLRAVNLKLGRGDTKTLEAKDQSDRTCTLRFISASGGAPKHQPVNFYFVNLYHGDELIEGVKIGASADDDRSQQIHLLTAKGFMNWSEPLRMPDGTSYRQFVDMQGKYLHAPLSVGLPQGIEGDFHLEISHSGSGHEEILLQIFNGNDYATLDRLTAQAGIQRVALMRVEKEEESEPALEAPPAPAAQVLAEESPQEDFSYGDGGLSIEAVDFHDAALASRLTYEFGEALHVTVQWRSSRAMQRVACVICIYGMDGRCISQVVSPQFSTDNRKTAGELSASFSPVMIGAGEYVVSVGFFEDLEEGLMIPGKPLCVQDRKYRLKILSPENIRMERGVVVHPVEWTI
ncbi:ABC transporter ATP-binding protein, partial [Paracidovorax citrulli]